MTGHFPHQAKPLPDFLENQNIEPPFKGDRSEGLPVKNRRFPIENPLVVVESGDFRGFLTYFGIFGPRMK